MVRLLIITALGVIFSSVLLAGALGPRSASAVPPNDNLANAITVTTPSIPGIVATGDSLGATVETNEKTFFTATDCPDDGINYHAGATVWYNWTAPNSGTFVFDTFGSSIDTTLAVYTGSAFPLTLVACREGSPVSFGPSALAFTATGGTTYRIQIGGFGGFSTGNIVLSIATDSGIYINTAADTNVRDSVITLREALLLANGSLAFGSLSPTEKTRVLNGAAAGGSGADLVHFSPTMNFDINLVSSLPILQFGSAHVSGIGTTVEVDGQGTIPETCFRFFNGGNAVSGLTIRRCPVGVWVESAGNRVGGSASSLERNIIRENTTAGVRIDGPAATNNHILGNYIGTNAAGGAAGPGNGVGVQIEDSAANNFVGGTSAGGRNIISGNGKGVRIFGAGAGNIVRGNYVGLNAAGSAAVPNTLGIEIIQAANNIIGPQSAGSFPDQRNVISGNSGFGIHINPVGSSFTTGNIVRGNYIGLAAGGTTAIGNLGAGVQLDPGTGAGANVIGGSVSGEGNVISGNGGFGVSIDGTNGNFVRGNLIGLDVGGTLDRGNSGAGVSIIDGSSDNVIGGALSAERNVISGNNGAGIDISGSGTSSNIVRGNYIGVAADGVAAVGNSGNGVELNLADANLVGGSSAGQGNVISANGFAGIAIQASSGHIVQGNLIGLDAGGTLDRGNATFGIVLFDGASNNTIGGGSISAERNVISGNSVSAVLIDGAGTAGNVIKGNVIGPDVNGSGGAITNGVGIAIGDAPNNTIGPANVISNNTDGVLILLSASENTVIKGNLIGTNLDGTAPVPNSGAGILINNSARGSMIGGTTPGDGNLIAFNGMEGVRVDGAVSPPAVVHTIRANSIHDNGLAEIENINGGNNELAPPVLTGSDGASVQGTACTGCTVDIFSTNTTAGDPFVYEGSTGHGGTFNFAKGGAFLGPNVVAIATDAFGNTSEVSNPIAANSDSDSDGVPNSVDACPSASEDADGFEDGDGCPDPDNDLDGICDPGQTSVSCTGSDTGQMAFYAPGHDHVAPTFDCRNIAEDYDGFKDGDGCPEPDNDNDGFPDSTDDCPGTDEQTGPDGVLGPGEDQNHNGILDGGEDTVLADGVLTTDDVVLTFEDYDGVLDTDGCHDSPGDDRDGDGYTDEVEALHVGTRADDPCGSDGWPSDLVSTGFSANKFDIQDLGSFIAPVRRIDTSPGDEPAFDKRWDLVPGTTFGEHINIQDLGATVSTASGFPPMFSGQKALGRTCIIAP